MKLKYKVVDNELIALGDMPFLTAGTGEAVEDFNGDVPAMRLDFFKRIGVGQIQEKTQAEKNIILNKELKFTPDRLKTYVNNGATQADKFDRLLNAVAKLAGMIQEQ